MELVAPGLHGEVVDAAACLAVFRGVIAGLNRDLLNGVHARLRLRRDPGRSCIRSILAFNAERLVSSGAPLTLTSALAMKNVPGIRFTIAFGFRIPALPAWLAPIPRTGRSSRVAARISWRTSPVSVFSKVAAAVTVTDSVDAPTSSAMSTRRTCATSTVNPDRVYFLSQEPTSIARTIRPAAERSCSFPLSKSRRHRRHQSWCSLPVQGRSKSPLRWNR